MIEPISEMINSAVDLTWPFIIIGVIIIVPLRLLYLYQAKQKVIVYKELLLLAVIIYILSLIQIVTFEDVVNYGTNNFIPFQEMMRYELGSRLFIKNVLGNILLFIPYGIFTSFFLKVKKLWIILLMVITSSIAIEITQLSIGRVFDIDDIILNVIGGILGFSLYHGAIHFKDSLPEVLKKEWILNVISILIVIGITFLIVGVL